MKVDADKSEEHLYQELAELRKLVAETDTLNKELKEAKAEIASLKDKAEKREKQLLRECKEHSNVLNELRMSRLIVERSPVILFRRLAGDNPQLEYISENLSQFGYSPEEFIRGDIHFRDIIHPDDFDRIKHEIDTHAETDVEEYAMIYRCLTKDGEVRWVEDKTSVVRDEQGNKTHNQGVLFDITERKLAKDALKKSEEKFRRIVETAGEGFLLLNEELLIVEVNDAYCQMLGYTAEELKGRRPFDFASDDFKEYLLSNTETMLEKEYRKFEGETIAKDGRVIPVLIHGSTLRDDQGEIIGNMAFVTDMTEHKKALMLAGEVQKSLLPQEKPDVKGLDIAGRNVSCDEIGGDYYDFIWRHEVGKGPFSVVVGDISGHGVESALLMTTARAFLRMRASQPGTISEIMGAMNRHLAEDVLDTGRFMTLFFLSIDPDNRRMDWVRAGHDPALLYDPIHDSFEELKGSGIALGVMNEVDYLENRRSGLVDGQIISIGTDGIWEAFNRKGEMFGKQRLQEIIRNNAKEDAATILAKVYAELKLFTTGRKSEDDITLVIIKISGLDSESVA